MSKIDTKELRQIADGYIAIPSKATALNQAADALDALEAEYEHAVLCVDRHCVRCTEQAKKRGLLPA